MLAERRETLIFYEAPHRLRSFLEDAREILGERSAAVARELTKIHEEIMRGALSGILARIGETDVKGEVTVILEGNTEKKKTGTAEILEALEYYSREQGLSMKESVQRVAKEFSVPRREVYLVSLRLKKGETSSDDAAPRAE